MGGLPVGETYFVRHFFAVSPAFKFSSYRHLKPRTVLSFMLGNFFLKYLTATELPF